MDISEPTLDRTRDYLSVVTSCDEVSSVKNKNCRRRNLRQPGGPCEAGSM